MKRGHFISLGMLAISLILLLSLPKERSDRWRVGWLNLFTQVEPVGRPSSASDLLTVENEQLRAEIARLKVWALESQTLLAAKTPDDLFFEKKSIWLVDLIEKRTCALPARVIFREPATWSSSLWIDVGNRDNRKIGRRVIGENSPVILGKGVVGVIDLVEEDKSRVRLITDRSLTPAVRAVRGGERDQLLSDELHWTALLLHLRKDLPKAEELALAIEAFREKLPVDARTFYLAKGEVCGSSKPLWRTLGQTLRGVGFNYAFADVEGGPFDVTQGAIIDGKRLPLVERGDLLVTTGMDGVFPQGLHVGIVSAVFSTKGGSSCELEARPVLSNINSLSEVFVLAPLVAK